MPEIIHTKKSVPIQGALWSVYILPLLLKKRPIQSVAIDTISRRKLDYTELYSPKYNQMQPSTDMPPALIVATDELGNPENQAFTLIEGAMRLTHAHTLGKTTYPCKIIPWHEVSGYINLQPIQGGYHYY